MTTSLQCPVCQKIVENDDVIQERCPRCGSFLDSVITVDTRDSVPLQLPSATDFGSSEPSSVTSDDRSRVNGQKIQVNASEGTEFNYEETISRRHSEKVSQESLRKLPSRFVKVGKDAIDIDPEYRLMEVIGEGNMGRVWLAEQTSLGREIALKYPKRDLASGASPIDGMFVSEVQVTGKLDHPNIISIYDLGRDELGSPFYAMKYVRGKEWLQLLKDQTLEQKLEVLLKVFDAVAFAHSKGYLHRDIKPENVMVGEFGEVVVMDWGIAIKNPRDHDDHSDCHDLAIAGTPAYMAPEMASGVFAELGESSDIYLLGAVLYQMIEGTPPHPQATDVDDALEKVRSNAIVKPKQAGELINIAIKALSTNPKDRFATVLEFKEAVKAYQSHVESIRLTEQGTRYLKEAKEKSSQDLYSQSRFAFLEAIRIWGGNQLATEALRKAKIAHARYCLMQGDYSTGLSLLDGGDQEQMILIRDIRRQIKQRESRERRSRIWRLLALGTSSLAVFLTIGFLVAIVYGTINNIEKKNEINEEKRRAVASEKESQSNAVVALKNGYEAQKQAQKAEKESWFANIRIAHEQIRRNEFNDATKTLEAISNSKQTDTGHMASENKHLESWVLDQMVKHPNENVVRPMNRQDSEPLEPLQILPNAQGILSRSDKKLTAIGQVEPELLIFRQSDDTKPMIAWAVSASGEYLAVVCKSGDTSRAGKLELSIYHRVSQSNLRTLPIEPFESKPIYSLELKTPTCTSLVFSNDGKWLLVSGSNSLVQVIPCSGQSDFKISGQSFELRVLPSISIHQAVFSPDSRYVAMACGDGMVRIWEWNNQGWKFFGRFDDHDGPVYSVVFSPDGSKVISGGLDRRLLIRSLSDAPESKSRVADAIEGKSIAKSNAIYSKDTESHDGSILSIAVRPIDPGIEKSPSASERFFIATGSNDQTIRIWDVVENNPRLTKVLRGHNRPVEACRFRQDKLELISVASDEYGVWDIDKYNFPTELNGSREDRLSDSFLLKSPGAVRSVATSRDGRWVAAGFSDASVIAWDFSIPEGTTTPKGTASVLRPEGHAFESKSAVWFNGGRQLITSGGDDTTCVWDQDRMVQTVLLRKTGWRGVIASSPWSKDRSQLLLTGSSDARNLALIWMENPNGYASIAVPRASQTSAPKLDWNQPSLEATCLAVSVDSTRIAIGDGQGDLHIYRYDPTNPAVEHLGTWPLSNSGLVDLFFVDGGRSVLVASEDGVIQKRSSNSGELTFEVRVSPGVTTMAASPDSSRFFLGFGNIKTNQDVVVAYYECGDASEIGAITRDSLSSDFKAQENLKITDLAYDHRDGRVVGILESFDSEKGPTDRRQKLIRLTAARSKYDWEQFDLNLPYKANGLLCDSKASSDSVLALGGNGGRFVRLGGAKPQSALGSSPGIFEVSTDLVSVSISELQRESNASEEVRYLAAGYTDGKIRIWESRGNRWTPFQNLVLNPSAESSKDRLDAIHVCFNPVEPHQLIALGQKSGLNVFTKTDQVYRPSPPVGDSLDAPIDIKKVCLSNDGLAFAVASKDGLFYHTRGASKDDSPWSRKKLHDEPCFDVCFSLDSNLLYYSGSNEVGQIALMQNTAPIAKKWSTTKSPAKLLVTPDGKRMIHSDGKMVTISELTDSMSSLMERLRFEDHKENVTEMKLLFDQIHSAGGGSPCALITADASGKIFLKWFHSESSRSPQGIPTETLGHIFSSTLDSAKSKASSNEKPMSSQTPLRPFESFSIFDPLQELEWEGYDISSKMGNSDSDLLEKKLGVGKVKVGRSRAIEDRLRQIALTESDFSPKDRKESKTSGTAKSTDFLATLSDRTFSLLESWFIKNTAAPTPPSTENFQVESLSLTLTLIPKGSGNTSNKGKEIKMNIEIRIGLRSD